MPGTLSGTPTPSLSRWARLVYALAASLGVALALIWAAHIGMDRALGYGLKRQSGFWDTHPNWSEA